jgi:oxygen-independent coproporphyrinogen-3 oxidase
MHPAAYLAAAGKADAIGGDDRIEPERRSFEFMLNALRLVDGFDLDLFSLRTGLAGDTIAPPLEHAVANGWLEVRGSHARPTEEGRRFNNDLVSLFL